MIGDFIAKYKNIVIKKANIKNPLSFLFANFKEFLQNQKSLMIIKEAQKHAKKTKENDSNEKSETKKELIAKPVKESKAKKKEIARAKKEKIENEKLAVISEVKKDNIIPAELLENPEKFRHAINYITSDVQSFDYEKDIPKALKKSLYSLPMAQDKEALLNGLNKKLVVNENGETRLNNADFSKFVTTFKFKTMYIDIEKFDPYFRKCVFEYLLPIYYTQKHIEVDNNNTEINSYCSEIDLENKEIYTQQEITAVNLAEREEINFDVLKQEEINVDVVREESIETKEIPVLDSYNCENIGVSAGIISSDQNNFSETKENFVAQEKFDVNLAEKEEINADVVRTELIESKGIPALYHCNREKIRMSLGIIFDDQNNFVEQDKKDISELAVDGLTEMFCITKPITLRGNKVDYAGFISMFNNFIKVDEFKNISFKDGFMDALVGDYYIALGKYDVDNPIGYMQACIWTTLYNFKYRTKSYNNLNIKKCTSQGVNKVHNYTGRNWDFDKLKELERGLLRVDSNVSVENNNLPEPKEVSKNRQADESKMLRTTKGRGVNAVINYEGREWDFDKLDEMERQLLRNGYVSTEVDNLPVSEKVIVEPEELDFELPW